LAELDQAQVQCADEPVLVVSPDDGAELVAGQLVEIELVEDESVQIQVPARHLVTDELRYAGVVLIPPVDAPWASQAEWIDFNFVVPVDGVEYDNLLAELARDAPSASVDTQVGDASTRTFFQQQRSLLFTSTVVGMLFCLFSLVLAGLSMGQDQLRSITALQLVGVARPRLRVAMSLSKALPVAVTAGGVALAAGLGGQAQLATFGMGPALNSALWAQAIVAAVVGVLLSAGTGALLIGKLDLAKPDARE
jgi:hypothetical protein